MKQFDYDQAIDDMTDVSGEVEDVADNFDMESDISTHTNENQPTTSVQVHHNFDIDMFPVSIDI